MILTPADQRPGCSYAWGMREPRPPLSVVIPTRGGLAEVAPALGALLPIAEASGTEVIVVGNVEGEKPPPGSPLRLVALPAAEIMALHSRGIEEASGEVIALGEDHAVPRTDWCEAVTRAHAEHPEAAAVAGCLVNATDATVVGRANFLAFAAAWQPPMPTLPDGRPPPASALSFKRDALEGIGSHEPGWLEGELIPSLFEQGLMAADDRIVVDHHQDHGGLWSLVNGFHSARCSYGRHRDGLTPAARRRLARWAIHGIPRRLYGEARKATDGTGVTPVESALVALITIGHGLGATTGTLFGPGRSGDRLA
jgi:hypothetical protein